MSQAAEVKARARALREQKAVLQARLEQEGGKALRLELAQVEEDLVDCRRQLRELMPRHKISRGTTWAGVEGWRWDEMQYRSWAELEGADTPEGPTEQDKMRLALRTAKQGITPTQADYLEQVGDKRQAQVARETGKSRSTICRTLQRGKARMAADAKALYDLLGRQEGGPLVVDLADPEVLGVVLSRLTTRQQTYLYLYYGEWLSLREIGTLLGVDHASVLRSIRCGLKRMEGLALGEQIEVHGLDSLEERLMAHFNHLPPEEEPKEKRTYQKQHKPPRVLRPVVLLPRLLRFVRGEGVRTVALGGGISAPEEGRWGTGRLLAWLEEQGVGRTGKPSLFRRLLYHLFTLLGRELHADHH